jgi:hypothetical protein
VSEGGFKMFVHVDAVNFIRDPKNQNQNTCKYQK